MGHREFESFYSVVVGQLPPMEVDSATALMLIDLERGAAHRDSGFGRHAAEHGLDDHVDYFFDRVESVVVPNTAAMLKAFRAAGLRVIHVRVMHAAADGADTSWRYKQFGVNLPPGSPGADFLEGVEPQPGEIVLDKNTSSVFVSTPADFVLRNLGITKLVVGGVVTNNCVESSVRMAADLGYGVILVDDMCAAWTEEGHRNSLRHMHRNFADVRSTEDVLGQVAGVRVL